MRENCEPRIWLSVDSYLNGRPITLFLQIQNTITNRKMIINVIGKHLTAFSFLCVIHVLLYTQWSYYIIIHLICSPSKTTTSTVFGLFLKDSFVVFFSCNIEQITINQSWTHLLSLLLLYFSLNFFPIGSYSLVSTVKLITLTIRSETVFFLHTVSWIFCYQCLIWSSDCNRLLVGGLSNYDWAKCINLGFFFQLVTEFIAILFTVNQVLENTHNYYTIETPEFWNVIYIRMPPCKVTPCCNRHLFMFLSSFFFLNW